MLSMFFNALIWSNFSDLHDFFKSISLGDNE